MKYKNRHSILLFIKSKIINPAFFSLSEAFFSDIEKELTKENYEKGLQKRITKKASTFKILRANIESCSETFSEQFNNTLLTFSFPTESKIEDASPVFKKLTCYGRKI